jgi:hypothetical protein
MCLELFNRLKREFGEPARTVNADKVITKGPRYITGAFRLYIANF